MKTRAILGLCISLFSIFTLLVFIYDFMSDITKGIAGTISTLTTIVLIFVNALLED